MEEAPGKEALENEENHEERGIKREKKRKRSSKESSPDIKDEKDVRCSLIKQELTPARPAVPFELLQELFFFIANPAITKGITRKPQKLPVRVRFGMHPSVHQLIFGTFDSTTLDDIAICECFGGRIKKTFRQGSYAIVSSPMDVMYDTRHFKSVISLRWITYNSFGERIWPFTKVIIKDEDKNTTNSANTV